jgi:TPP-dependent pyruvate/acetoin dehydrogenase alpha subunit
MSGQQHSASDAQVKELLGELGADYLRDRLGQMILIRTFERQMDQLHARGKTYGTLHLGIGQEATSVGVVAAVNDDDYLLSHHRGHGHFLARTDEPNRLMAEVLGKQTGFCRGRGGTMHVADLEQHLLGGNGIVGGGLPISVGVGLSIKMRDTKQVCLTLFGDGAANEGAFHESLNMASIWNLPVIYVCENNRYAMSTPVTQAFNIPFISQRAAAYGIPGVTVDGNDFFAVYLATRQAAERARSGDGPTLIESLTYRIKGHSRSDRQAYRTRDEVRQWQEPEKDPILRLSAVLLQYHLLSQADVEKLEQEAKERVAEAVRYSEASPEPDPAAVMEGVYA